MDIETVRKQVNEQNNVVQIPEEEPSVSPELVTKPRPSTNASDSRDQLKKKRSYSARSAMKQGNASQAALCGCPNRGVHSKHLERPAEMEEPTSPRVDIRLAMQRGMQSVTNVEITRKEL